MNFCSLKNWNHLRKEWEKERIGNKWYRAKRFFSSSICKNWCFVWVTMSNMVPSSGTGRCLGENITSCTVDFTFLFHSTTFQSAIGNDQVTGLNDGASQIRAICIPSYPLSCTFPPKYFESQSTFIDRNWWWSPVKKSKACKTPPDVRCWKSRYSPDRRSPPLPRWALSARWMFLRIEVSESLEAAQRTHPYRFLLESFGRFSTLPQDGDLSDICLGLILLLQGPHAIFAW